MKLENIRHVGRFTNPDTGKPVNVKKGKQVSRSVDHYFFLRSGKRVFIDLSGFYDKWKKLPDTPTKGHP